MSRGHVTLYHSVYWIYRVINIWAFVYFIYGESWYRGAYAVLLILMPFFYINYGLLIPSLLEKKHWKFFILTFLWIISFVWVYSNWTIYQRNILYDEGLRLPDYIETLNNLISIWLISSGACLFEFWIKNRNKNKKLTVDRKNHLLKSEQNIMLNHLLSDYLNTLDRVSLEELPDKILLTSDFFKYILYNRDKPVTLKTEMTYVKMYEELKNSNGKCVKIHCEIIAENLLIRSSQIIAIINNLVDILFTNKVVEMIIVSRKFDKVFISMAMPLNYIQKEILTSEFINSTIKHEDDDKCIVSVDLHLANSPAKQGSGDNRFIESLDLHFVNQPPALT
jgi:hypothetical protein